MPVYFPYNRGHSNHNILNTSNYRRTSKGQLERVRPRARSGPPAGYSTHQDRHGFLHAYAGDLRGNTPVDPALRARVMQPQIRPYPGYGEREYVLHPASKKKKGKGGSNEATYGSSNLGPYQGGPYSPYAGGVPDHDPNLYSFEGGVLTPKQRKPTSRKSKDRGGLHVIPTPGPYGPPIHVPVYGGGDGYWPVEHQGPRGRSHGPHKGRGRDIRDDLSPKRSSSYHKNKHNNNKHNNNSYNSHNTTTHHHTHHHYHSSSGRTHSHSTSHSNRIRNWIDSTHSGAPSTRRTTAASSSAAGTFRWPGQHRREPSPEYVVRPRIVEIRPRDRYERRRDDGAGGWR